MVYNRLRGGRIVRCVRLATYAKAVRLRPAFLSEAPAGFFRQGFASAYGCSRQGVPSVFHSVPLHLRTSPNRKSTAGHCGGCVLPYRCAKVSGAGSAYGRYLPLPAQQSLAIASFCVDLLQQIDSNTEVLAMDLLFSENAQLHFTTRDRNSTRIITYKITIRSFRYIIYEISSFQKFLGRIIL